MDLKLFLSPVEESIFYDIDDAQSFYHHISIFHENMPDYRSADLALIGIQENRGNEYNDGVNYAASEIRKKLYRLRRGSGRHRIVDLGNLNNGIDLEETYIRLQEVCAFLLEKNVLPILMGGSHDMDLGQYRAYENMEKMLSVLNVDAFLDLEDHPGVIPAKKHVQQIFLHSPNYLFHYSHLANQSYLVGSSVMNMLEKMYFESVRIGQIRANIKETEPIIRNADMLSFDITAIKSNDAPGNYHAQPFGLTGEEACQICWYAGTNEKMSSAGFYEYNPDYDDDNKKTASVVATMIWYFIEGYYNRKDSLDYRSNDYLKYVVSLPVEPESIVFYKSKLSEKWWLEIPVTKNKLYDRNYIIPCSYSDYQTASTGEVPERYISAYSKIT